MRIRVLADSHDNLPRIEAAAQLYSQRNVEHRRQHSLLLNPGEVGGWLTGSSTVAIVDLQTLDFEIVDI